MSNGGYIALHRKLLDWEWFNDADTLMVFIYLLLRARHKAGQWRGITIDKGQVITGRKVLSAELKLSEQRIRTILARLEHSGEITKKSTSKYTLVTLVKYSSYQDSNQQSNQRATNEQPTTNQQLTTNNNDNNDNNIVVTNVTTGKTPTEVSPIPTKKIIDLWNDFAQENGLPKVVKTTEALKSQIKQRWKEDLPKLNNWENYFEFMTGSDFLMGRTQPSNGRPVFRATLAWSTKAGNFAKIAAREYHHD